MWPINPLEKALYGEKEMAHLRKLFGIPGSETADTDVANVAYTIFKKEQTIVKKLQTSVRLLKILPISSAACEQGFSQMNLHQTKIRNRLLVETVNQLMMIN
jgi:hypothetical protein